MEVAVVSESKADANIESLGIGIILVGRIVVKRTL